MRAAPRDAGRPVSIRLVRRGWAVVSREPQITMRALAQRLGRPTTADVASALHVLRDAGYIHYAKHGTGRTIVVPFIVQELH